MINVASRYSNHQIIADRSHFLPDQFCAHLEELAKADLVSEAPATPSEKVNRGYKVKRSAPKLTPEELKAKEDAAMKIIKEGMKKKSK